MALVDLGSNDIANNEDTTAQSLTNIEQIVATLQAAGTDVIIVIPQPFGGTAYATGLPALRAGLEAYATANNIPVIDLSATYDNSEADLEAAGLKSDLLHGDATLYADIGSQLATLLTQTIANTAKTNTTKIANATFNVAAAVPVQVQDQHYTLSAAQAGTLITGNGETSTELEITGGGNAVLNAADTGLTVKLDGPTHLTLSSMQFVAGDGSAGGSTIIALAGNQTLLGGQGDVLIGAAVFGDLFKGSAELMNQNIIQNFGGSDQIDLTDILASKVTGLNWTATSTGGVLTLTDGVHKTALNLVGNYTAGGFEYKADSTAGTLITYQ